MYEQAEAAIRQTASGQACLSSNSLATTLSCYSKPPWEDKSPLRAYAALSASWPADSQGAAVTWHAIPDMAPALNI